MKLTLVEFIAVAVVMFSIGLSLGYYVLSHAPIDSIQAIIIQSATVIGTIIVTMNFITKYLKENIFEYAGVFRKGVGREEWATRKSGFGGELTGTYNEIGFYLRVDRKKGQGRLEECEGQIELTEPNGTVHNINTVWDGFFYCRYRNVSMRDDLRLFHISEDGEKILLFSHYDDSEARNPYRYMEILYQVALTCTISVRLGAKSGNVPKKPFVMKIDEIIKTAKDA